MGKLLAILTSINPVLNLVMVARSLALFGTACVRKKITFYGTQSLIYRILVINNF
jgi:hypothetical protein